MSEKWKDRVAFLFVYIHEAHASDEWQMPANVKEGVVFEQPKSIESRREVAGKCCTTMQMLMTCVVDDMNNSVDNAYAAWPERFFIVDRDGKIAYAGAQGPWGFKPEEVEAWLRDHRQ